MKTLFEKMRDNRRKLLDAKISRQSRGNMVVSMTLIEESKPTKPALPLKPKWFGWPS